MTNHIKCVTLDQDKFPTKDHYPFTLPIFNKTKKLPFDTPATLFVGENDTKNRTNGCQFINDKIIELSHYGTTDIIIIW